MTDELRFWLTLGAGVGYGLFALLALRSWRESRRVAIQWENEAGDHWRAGKLALVLGIIGIFISALLPHPWRSAVFFGCLMSLIYGEYRIGSGFRDVADAQDRWHRRNFGEE